MTKESFIDYRWRAMVELEAKEICWKRAAFKTRTRCMEAAEERLIENGKRAELRKLAEARFTNRG